MLCSPRQRHHISFHAYLNPLRDYASEIQSLHLFTSEFNPLGAKQSFQLLYPGGQRLKVISFS